MCVTDRHDMTLAVKVAVNPNTTNQELNVLHVKEYFTSHLGPYSPTILIVCLVLQIYLYLAAFECNTTSDWLNPTVQPIRRCVTFKLINLGEKDKECS